MKLRTRLALLIATVTGVLIVLGGLIIVTISDRLVRNSVDRDLGRRINLRLGPARQRAQNQPFVQQPNGRGPQGIMGGPLAMRPPEGDFLMPRLLPPPGEQVSNPPRAIDDDAIQMVRGSNRPYFSTITRDQKTIRVVTIRHENGAIGQAGYDLTDVERITQTQVSVVLVLLPIAAMLGALAGYWLADKAVKPIERVTDAASKIEEHALTTRLPIEGNDEIASLSRQFNMMLGRLEASFGQRDALVRRLESMLAAQRAFVADASHELKTPLARLKLIASAALYQNSSPEDLKAALNKVNTGADDMTDLVQQLLVLARHDSAVVSAQDQASLGNVVRRAISIAEGREGPAIQVGAIPNFAVMGREQDLARALANVIENAKKYASESPWIDVFCEAVEPYIRVSVRDQGSGIEAEHLSRLTERFYRVDAARDREGGGTGLGLAITKAIMESAGGRVEIQSEVGKGTTFHLFFRICA